MNPKLRQEREWNAGGARLELLPEGLRVELPGGDDGKTVQVLLRVLSSEVVQEQERAELLQQVSEQPLVLARLLEEGAGALGALLPESSPWRLDAAEGDSPAAPMASAAVCSCGVAACGHLPQAMAIGEAAWAADAGLRLALVGWAPEALADAALACWAAAQPLPEPQEALRAYAGGPDAPQRSARREGQGPHLAEWLADMAGQGHLHLPGPRFHDVAAGLRKEFLAGTPYASAAAEPRLDREPGGPDAAPWAALLPGVSGAAKGLELIAARVRERAAELAAGPDPEQAGSPNGKTRL